MNSSVFYSPSAHQPIQALTKGSTDLPSTDRDLLICKLTQYPRTTEEEMSHLWLSFSQLSHIPLSLLLYAKPSCRNLCLDSCSTFQALPDGLLQAASPIISSALLRAGQELFLLWVPWVATPYSSDSILNSSPCSLKISECPRHHTPFQQYSVWSTFTICILYLPQVFFYWRNCYIHPTLGQCLIPNCMYLYHLI